MRTVANALTDDRRKIPLPDFTELRQEIDLPTLVSEYTTIHASRRGEYRAACPIHGGRNRNFRIWQDTSHEWHYKCYSKCQAGGDCVTFLEQMEGISRAQAVGQLYRRLGRGGHGTGITYRPPVAPRPEPAPLSPRTVEPYVNCLDLPIDPTGRDRTTPRDWWHGQGVEDAAISAFRLGYCTDWLTTYDPRIIDRPMPSATIPIFEPSGALVNIRHRLIRPPHKQGDKYRPHAPDLGAHLFNTQSLTTLPDGTARREKRTALIWEGEKKVMIGASRYDWLLGFLYPIITADSGVGSWTGWYGEQWAPLLQDYERVVVLFDPGPDAIQSAAEQTAMLFGRSGCVVTLREKVDDWLLAEPAPGERLERLVQLIEDARPLRAGSIWAGW